MEYRNQNPHVTEEDVKEIINQATRLVDLELEKMDSVKGIFQIPSGGMLKFIYEKTGEAPKQRSQQIKVFNKVLSRL